MVFHDPGDVAMQGSGHGSSLEERRRRLLLRLHKWLDWVLDELQRPDLNKRDHQWLQDVHDTVRRDINDIVVGTDARTIAELEHQTRDLGRSMRFTFH